MSAASPRAAEDEEAILASLELKLPGRRLPIGYLLNLLVVLLAWSVLVAVYIALVAGFAAVAVFGASCIPQANGFWELAFAVGTILFGATVALFLLKPLFAARALDGERWALHEKDEPLLYAYVARLARLVGAPPPDRIVVDTRVNASAGHLNLLSRRRGRLELTLGLPLVKGLSLRELTGVLAHEFGHFRQGLGARLGMIVRRMNLWFYRTALERDALDSRLAEFLDESEAPLIRLPFLLAALVIAGCRWVLYLELRIGAVLGSFWSRQMEYDADRWEAVLSGGATFADTALRLRILEVSSGRAHDDLAVAYREGRLADDLPGLIAARAALMPREVATRVRTAMLSHRTRLTDSHPSDLDRIERARAFGPGIFRGEGPASALFSDLSRVCRSASLHYYRQELGLEVTSRNLVPTEGLLPGGADARRGGDVNARFYQGFAGASRLLFLDYATVPPLPENARQHLRKLRERFLEVAPRGRAAYRELDRAFDLRMRATAASRLAAAGVAFRPSDFNLPSASEQGLEQARGRAEALEAGALDAAVEAEKLIRQRVLLALALMREAGLAAAVGGAEPLRKATALVAALAALQRVKTEFQELSVNLTAFEPVFAVLRMSEAHAEELTEGALELLSGVDRAMHEVLRKVAQDRYPWGHVNGDLTMARYLVPEVPPPGEWLRLREAAHEVCRRYLDAHERLITELAALAESVEDAAGMPRLAPLVAAEGASA